MMVTSISRRAFIAGTSCAAGATSLLGLSSCDESTTVADRAVLGGETMGTTYSVMLADPSSNTDPDSLRAGIEQILHGVDTRMSTYGEHSELSRFNLSRSTDWFSMSPDTLGVIEAGFRISRLSSGVFDITVGPVVDRWGFGPSRRRKPVSEFERAKLVEAVDYRRIEKSQALGAIRKLHPDAGIDLSGIAKGFAVDRVADHLKRVGMTNFLVEVGGEFRACGMAPRGEPWKLGIERPLTGAIAVHLVVQLTQGALATSGDYRNWFERDGQRYSHIVDPRTGRPIATDLASVSVISDTAMDADALATALAVLGPEAGWSLATREQIAALFIMRKEDGFTNRATSEFKRHLAV